MCEYMEDMNTALGLMRMVFYELFSGLQKVIWLLLYFGLLILLVWGYLSEEWLSSFFMAGDQGSTPMTLCMCPSPPNPPFPYHQRCFNYICCREQILLPLMNPVCFTGGATEFSFMRFSRLVSYLADYHSSNFSFSNWGDMKSWSKLGVLVSVELVFGHTKPVLIAKVAGLSRK